MSRQDDMDTHPWEQRHAVEDAAARGDASLKPVEQSEAEYEQAVRDCVTRRCRHASSQRAELDGRLKSAGQYAERAEEAERHAL